MLDSAVYIDGHCHLHDQVDTTLFLESAKSQIRQNASNQIPVGQLRAVLCLADYTGARGFIRLLDQCEQLRKDGWEQFRTKEDYSIKLVNNDGDRIWVIAGYQTVTKENIEVLSIGTNNEPASKQPLNDTIQDILNSGAMAVLPWGFGKWWGKRGKMVRHTMERYGQKIVLGDNGGRPRCCRPKMLKVAQMKRHLTIPGSDPLPLKKDQLRNGGYGFMLYRPIADEKPANWLLNCLKSLPKTPDVFGNPLCIKNFLSLQLALRLKMKFVIGL
jgi:hypothetical protein